VLCPARPKVVCVYIAPECSNGGLHDNANLDAADLDPVVLLVLRLLVAHLLLGLVVLLLLLLTTVLHLLLLARVATGHRVRSSVVRLAVLCVLRLVLIVVVEVRHLRRSVAAGLQLDVHATFVVLGVVLQAEFAADLLDARLDLLHVVHGVVSLADDHVEVRLAVLLGVANALLEDFLGFFDELAVQVDGVTVYFADGIVLAEDELGGLLVVLVGFGCVLLALLRQLFRLGAVAALVGLLRARGEVLVLALLFTSEVSEAVVFALRITVGSVVEGWRALLVVEYCEDRVLRGSLPWPPRRSVRCDMLAANVWISECGRNTGCWRGCDLIYANGLHKPERASRAGRGVGPLQHLVCLSAGTCPVVLYKFTYSYSATTCIRRGFAMCSSTCRYHENHYNWFRMLAMFGEHHYRHIHPSVDTTDADLWHLHVPFGTHATSWSWRRRHF
jgi:hypothetical protein